MAVIKEIAEQEKQRMASGVRDELHLYREGTFLNQGDCPRVRWHEEICAE